MGKISHFLISGALWTTINLAIGWWGWSLTNKGGVWVVLGWLIVFVAFGFVSLSLILMFRTASSYRKGMRWMREDPEGFAKAQADYEATVRRLQQNELKPNANQVELVSNEEFARRTHGGEQPNPMDLSAYEGHRFLCTCGEHHTFHTNQVPVLKKLPGRRLVLACPNEAVVTCVRLEEPSHSQALEHLFGAQAVPDST